MMRFLTSSLIAFALLSGTALAAADDPPLPKPDLKGQWRVITQDDATTTSKCIGSTVTPLCAMETLMASSVRFDENEVLYRKSALLLPEELRAEPRNYGKPVRPRTNWLKYRILSAEVLTRQIPPVFHWCRKRHPTECKDIPSAWQPGDVRIKITSRECLAKKCSREEGADRGSVLRQMGDEWKVVLMRPFVTQVHDVDGKPIERR